MNNLSKPTKKTIKSMMKNECVIITQKHPQGDLEEEFSRAVGPRFAVGRLGWGTVSLPNEKNLPNAAHLTNINPYTKNPPLRVSRFD